MRIALAAVAVSALASCSPARTPEGAYRAFVEAASHRDADGAFQLLSKGTQEALTRRAGDLAAGAPGVVSSDPRDLLLGDAASAVRPLKSVTLVRESGERAVLRVEEDGAAASEVQMAREGRTWRVDLAGKF